MPITRRQFAAGSLAAPAILKGSLASAAGRPVTVASLLGEDKPETKIWLKISELVEAKLPGQFRFNIVKSGALGGEKEVAEGVRLGSVQASLSTVSSLSGWVPELQLLDLLFHRPGVIDHGVRAEIEAPFLRVRPRRGRDRRIGCGGRRRPHTVRRSPLAPTRSP